MCSLAIIVIPDIKRLQKHGWTKENDFKELRGQFPILLFKREKKPDSLSTLPNGQVKWEWGGQQLHSTEISVHCWKTNECSAVLCLLFLFLCLERSRGSGWAPGFHSLSLRCLSVLISSLQMRFTLLLLFIPTLKRCGLLFVLVFKPILESGLFREFKRALMVLLAQCFIAYWGS